VHQNLVDHLFSITEIISSIDVFDAEDVLDVDDIGAFVKDHHHSDDDYGALV